MNFWDSFKISLNAIAGHKMRSILTMLGIVIGVSSIIIIVSIGQSGEKALKSNLAGSDNNTIDMMFTYDDENKNYSNEALTYNTRDIENLQSIPEIDKVVPKNTEYTTISGSKQSKTVEMIGITSQYYFLENLEVNEGREISSFEMSNSRRVALLNEKTAKSLFNLTSPVNQYIEVNGISVKIIGVYQEDIPVELQTEKVLIPLQAWPLIFNTEEITSLTIVADKVENMQVAGEKAVSMMNNTKEVSEEGTFEVLNMKEIQDGIASITKIMTGIVGAIASISLFVGGIGVMNIMLVSVTERTKEIGIRKALGASRGKILLQFLIESAFLTFIGGVIGIVIGYCGSYLFSLFSDWPFTVSIPIIAIGCLFSMAIGVVFGIMPANKAAKLEPIDALRYE
jgi:putative ABC transport system permease protein